MPNVPLAARGKVMRFKKKKKKKSRVYELVIAIFGGLTAALGYSFLPRVGNSSDNFGEPHIALHWFISFLVP
jgi:uncharacterized membrane-anchored protein YitT (DUF2179 family)